MANFKGTNITAMDATPSTKVKSSQVHGRLRVFKDEYEAAGEAIGSTITIARLPRGAVVYDVTLHYDALGTSSTLAVGDAADADRYIVASASASAGKKILGAIAGFAFEQTAETDVMITTAGAAITGTIKSAVYYTVD